MKIMVMFIITFILFIDSFSIWTNTWCWRSTDLPEIFNSKHWYGIRAQQLQGSDDIK